MKLSIVTQINHSADACFTAMRYEMPNLARCMPKVEKIEVVEREESSTGVQLTNRWHAASTEIPALARPFIDPDKVFWLDHAHWTNGEQRCAWRLELGFLTERGTCEGFTIFTAESDQRCKMEIDGALSLDLKGLVPRLMVGRATKGVEQFILKLMEPNFRRMGRALTEFLDSK